MSEPPNDRTDFAGQIGVKAARKLKAPRNPKPGVWFGLGMMGLIGWSVTRADIARRRARHLAGQASSRHPFLDARAPGRGAHDWLSERVALGRQ